MMSLSDALLKYAADAPVDENALPPSTAQYGYPTGSEWGNKPPALFMIPYCPSLASGVAAGDANKPLQNMIGKDITLPYYQLCSNVGSGEAAEYLTEYPELDFVLYVLVANYGNSAPEADFEDAYELPPLKVTIQSAKEVLPGKWLVYGEGALLLP